MYFFSVISCLDATPVVLPAAWVLSNNERLEWLKMASYLTIYATMNKLLNFFRKKTDKNGDKNKGTTSTSDPPDDVTPGPSTALASLPPNLSPGLKDALAQLNGEPISKVSTQRVIFCPS